MVYSRSQYMKAYWQRIKSAGFNRPVKKEALEQKEKENKQQLNKLYNDKSIKKLSSSIKDFLRTEKIINNITKTTDTRESGTRYTEYKVTTGKVSSEPFLINLVSEIMDVRKLNQGKLKVVMKTKNGYISTPIVDYNDLNTKINELFVKVNSEYDKTLVVSEMNIVSVTSVNKDNIFGQGSDSASVNYKDGWLVVGNVSKTNCLYQSFVIAEHKTITPNVVVLSKKLKSRVGAINKNGSQYEDIERLADYKKTNIVLHADDEEKSIIKFFKGEPKPDKNKNRTKIREDIHIVYDSKRNHFMAMFQGKKEDLVIEKPRIFTESGPIKKRFKENTFKKDFMSWDIEASPDDNHHFKSYAVGFFDGEKYFDWWGLDCLDKLEDHLYTNRNKYDNKFLYAHNGGKFDVLLLMSEVLLCSKRFEIDTTGMGCLELNGRWLNVTLISNDGKKIHFRDSCALLPGKLDDLTKDFKVKHQKLPDTVDHKKITLQNWNTWENLPRYLEHDVLGLYECLDQFSEDIWEATSNTKNSRELFCKDVIEKLTDKKFVKAHPDWLNKDGKRLKINMYNDDLKLGLEYNGDQHYKLCIFNKFDKEILAEQKKKDKWKQHICKEHKVNLINIPFWFTKQEIVDKIKEKLNINKEIDFSTMGYRGSGINITECLTGASLSKKYYFYKYYDHFKKPIWCLSDKLDKYIRSGYFGGRVEIFNFKRVRRDKFFYYDFTSLFPAMALKLLPYGEPIEREAMYINENLDNFFGFIRCRVTTKDKTYKPLHAVKHDGKLLFMNLHKHEITLFSEELKLGKKLNQYDYEIIDGVEFKKAHIMEKMQREVFNFKAQAKKDGKDALSLVWKIILNSSYGFWGLRTKEREAVKVFKKGQAPVQAFLNNNKLKDEVDIGNYTLLKVLNDLETTDFNVAIAAAITSYARCELWSLIRDIQMNKHEVYMCDTDSIVCSLDLNDYPEIKERYQWDGFGNELGTLKNELNDYVLKKMKGKLDENQTNRIKNENLYFDECILNGAKFYSLKNNEFNIDISKCKGWTQKDDKLTFDTMKKPLEQTVDQFRSGYASYMDPQYPFKVKLVEVTKVIEPFYSKGNISKDRTIKPLDEKNLKKNKKNKNL